MMKDLEIQLWMSKNGLPEDMKTVIMNNVKQRLEEDKDVDVENLFSILSRNNKKSIKRHLCMDTLKKVCDALILHLSIDIIYIILRIYTKQSIFFIEIIWAIST